MFNSNNSNQQDFQAPSNPYNGGQTPIPDEDLLPANFPDESSPAADPAAPAMPTTPIQPVAAEPTADPAPASNFSTPVDVQPSSPTASTSLATDDLATIKQNALQQLAPLVDRLDQTPEDKFRTTMMMIQASDNQGLLKDAYTIAQEIKDDKARAQAFLDVINEINYFSQQATS